jgi:beta-lactam-binding protein with PASTA domain
VVDYDPKQAAEGATIDLIISDGPEVLRVQVPNVICESVDQALTELREANLQPELAGNEENPDCQPGEVSQTNPGPGEEVNEGTQVAVFTHPEPTPTSPPPTTPSPTPTESPSPTPTIIPTESPLIGDEEDG